MSVCTNPVPPSLPKITPTSHWANSHCRGTLLPVSGAHPPPGVVIRVSAAAANGTRWPLLLLPPDVLVTLILLLLPLGLLLLRVLIWHADLLRGPRWWWCCCKVRVCTVLYPARLVPAAAAGNVVLGVRSRGGSSHSLALWPDLLHTSVPARMYNHDKISIDRQVLR